MLWQRRPCFQPSRRDSFEPSDSSPVRDQMQSLKPLSVVIAACMLQCALYGGPVASSRADKPAEQVYGFQDLETMYGLQVRSRNTTTTIEAK